MADLAPVMTVDEQCRYTEALDTLPPLTRAVLLLSTCDDLSYPEIGWRCGLGVVDVQVRLTDALIVISRHNCGRRSVVGRLRLGIRPLRDRWAAARCSENDRRLSPWLPSERRPGKRGMMEWLAWAYEHFAR